MLKKEDIEHLADLARLRIAPEEMAAFPAQLDAILDYVSQLTKIATADIVPEAGELRNVMRPDADVRAGGEFTEAILENAPRKADGYIKVPRIIS